MWTSENAILGTSMNSRIAPVPLPDAEPVPASHPLLRRAGRTDNLYTVLLHGGDERLYVGWAFGRLRTSLTIPPRNGCRNV
jgi:hypothetical protein